jgi:hypothetical protein
VAACFIGGMLQGVPGSIQWLRVSKAA